MVKAVQKVHPEKRGDPSSMRFSEQWLSSCDEAEKDVIFRSSYKTYISLSRLVPMLVMVAMLANLFFETGMLAVILLVIIWIYITVVYCVSCLKMQKVNAEKGNK